MEEFQRLSRDLVQKGAIIDYYQDTIKVPNGNIVKWDFIKHKGAAAVVPVDDKGRLIMVRQYRNALDRYTLEIPAGGLNGENEPTDQAALRELTEETGYHAEKIELLLRIRTTVAFCNEKKQHLDEDEFVTVKAYDLDELISMILDGTFEDSKTVSAILAYKEKYVR